MKSYSYLTHCFQCAYPQGLTHLKYLIEKRKKMLSTKKTALYYYYYSYI